jgi:DNA-binding response OmpR family regulator
MLVGADTCVSKPFVAYDLLDRVRQLVVRRPEAA